MSLAHDCCWPVGGAAGDVLLQCIHPGDLFSASLSPPLSLSLSILPLVVIMSGPADVIVPDRKAAT